ncbi:MAG: ABC transporter permease [Ruaniaceae bacterium]|nr:ABC transporter permease [Ruaniaceae bacterium]
MWIHSSWELRSLMRNGEQLLISFALPVLALIGLLRFDAFGLADPRFALAGALAMAVLASAFTSQAIGLAMDRRYGVLRMFATTAIGPAGLLGGKAIAIVAIAALQTITLAIAAWLLGIREPVNWFYVAGFVVLGVVAGVGLAVLIGGTMRAEAVIAVANLLWILMLVAGALLPPQLGVFGFLPPGALGEGLRAATLGSFDAVSALVLAAWAAVLGWLASRALKWD